MTERRVFPAGNTGRLRAQISRHCSHTAASIPIVHFRVVSNTSFMINYAAVRCSLMAQPAWRQLQESSMVSLASSQYWLQYFMPLATRQLHAGCSHFFVSLCMRRPPLTEIDILLFRLTESPERYGFPTDPIATICFKRSSNAFICEFQADPLRRLVPINPVEQISRELSGFRLSALNIAAGVRGRPWRMQPVKRVIISKTFFSAVP